MRISRRPKGFAVLAVVVGFTILAAMASTMVLLVASNQSLRTNQMYMDQAFFNSIAGLEVSRKGIAVSGNDCAGPTYYLLGQPLTIQRSVTKISAIGTYGNASNTFSINNPTVSTMQGCLNLQFATATMGSNYKQVDNIYVGRKSTCCYTTIYINSMTISWSPNNGETLTKINFSDAAGQQYQTQGNGLPSGSTFPFATPYPITGTVYKLIDFISWHSALNHPVTVNMTFNMSDGTSQTLSVVGS